MGTHEQQRLRCGGTEGEAERRATPVGDAWRAVPTTQRMADGATMRTYGIVERDGTWVGKVHPLTGTDADLAEARRRAVLFAGSAGMAEALLAALVAFAGQFDRDEDVSRSDLAAWFAIWRREAKAALRRAGAI